MYRTSNMIWCLDVSENWGHLGYPWIWLYCRWKWRFMTWVKCKVYTIGYPIFRHVQRMRTAQNQEMHVESKNIQTTNLYRFWLESLAGLWFGANEIPWDGQWWTHWCPKHSRNPGWICKISVFLGKEQFQIALRWWFFPKSFHVPSPSLATCPPQRVAKQKWAASPEWLCSHGCPSTWIWLDMFSLGRNRFIWLDPGSSWSG